MIDDGHWVCSLRPLATRYTLYLYLYLPISISTSTSGYTRCKLYQATQAARSTKAGEERKTEVHQGRIRHEVYTVHRGTLYWDTVRQKERYTDKKDAHTKPEDSVCSTQMLPTLH